MVGFPDPVLGERVCAVVVPRPDAQRHHARAAGAQTGGQRALQQVGGDARVLADDHAGRRLAALRQHGGRSLADTVGQRRIQRFVDDTANSVGTE